MDKSTSTAFAMTSRQIPLWFKIVYTLFLCMLVPIYATHYPLTNFLWFSDIALLTTAASLWLESRLLASMMAVAVVLPELLWNLSFFTRLIFGVDAIGSNGYMFDRHLPLYLRGLSLFHVALPLILIWMVYRLGYDRRAFIAQSLVALVVLPLTYAITNPADNINWVFGPGNQSQHTLPPLLYLLLLMAVFVLAIHLPTHLVFGKFCTSRTNSE
jgi:hypothetical protein